MKIAITSSDGQNVDQHFGKNKKFYVYDFKEGNIIFIEKRETECYSIGSKEHKFDAERFNKVFNLIKDCELIYTAKIGKIPFEKFKERGVKVVSYLGKISNILSKKHRGGENENS